MAPEGRDAREAALGIGLMVIGGRPERDDEAAAIEAALLADGAALVPADARRGLQDTAPPPADREHARATLLRARAALRAFELEEASKLADDAVAELLALPHLEDHRGLLFDTLLFQAGLAGARGDDDEAASTLQLAARLEPARDHLDPALHPPSLVEGFARAIADNATADADVATLAVQPPPIDADSLEVFVDGTARVLVDGAIALGTGPHLVLVRTGKRDEGVLRFARGVFVLAPGLSRVDLHLDQQDGPARRHAAWQRLRDGDESALAAIRTLCDARAVLGLLEDRAVLVDQDGARPFPLADGAAASAAALQVALRAPPDDDRTDRGPPAASVDEDGVPGWVWIGLGSVAVVGVTAVGVTGWWLWEGQPPAPPPRPAKISCCL